MVDLRKLRVFLSYASQDRSKVRELSLRLVKEGWIDVWIDEKKLLPGQDWRIKIEEAVEESDIVIICLSNRSVSKEGYVQKEIRYAREIALEKPEGTIFLIPLRLDECNVPRGLRFLQWVDYFGENKDESYRAIIESLKERVEQRTGKEIEEQPNREEADDKVDKRITYTKDREEAKDRINSSDAKTTNASNEYDQNSISLAAPVSSPLRRTPLAPMTIVLAVSFFPCLLGGFLWYLDSNYLWCSVFPFLGGC
ncbi:MAG TPA: toll/interleukin-1 receptor domain-containing protein [Anaerolineales bacterium]|nr:toll/interleukin-1 receptor domain-containing protein [Anaerolineales bacterium]